MFKCKQPDGRFLWINPSYVQAVLPGPNLGTCAVIVQTGPILIDGTADEIGETISKMMLGVEPLIDLNPATAH